MLIQKIQLRAWCEKSADGNLRIVASDESMDRSGESIPFESWDLSAFEKSPRLLIDHDYRVQAIVGKAVKTEKDSTRKAVTFEPLFHDITQAARETKAMVDQGFLDTVSVGFLRKTNENGIESNELMEISFVAVPANANARTLSVKAIGPSDEKAIKEFLNDETDAKAEAVEGDTCQMDDGTEGVMTMDDQGELVCVLQKAEPAEGDPCQMDDGTAGTMGKDEAGNMVCMLPKTTDETKGLIEDVNGSHCQMMKIKGQYIDRMFNCLFNFIDAYLSDATPVEKVTEMVDELCINFKAAATTAVVDVPEDGEVGPMMMGVKKIAERIEVELDVKAGKVISAKNRSIITTARDSMQSGIVALDDLLAATEPSEGDAGKAQAKPEIKKGRELLSPSEDSLEKFVELRRVTRAVNTALCEALRNAKLHN